MKIFLQCHIAEQTGHGVPKVVRKYGAQAYDFGTSTITVTIPFDRSGFKRGDVPVNVPVKQTDEDKIVEAIKLNNRLTMDDMARIIGKTRKTVMRLLKKSDRIIRVGFDKTGHWEIKK